MVSPKLKGKFYTPKPLAEWMVFYLSNHFSSPIRALEPSCGSGIFIDAIDASSIAVSHLDVVEIEEAATKHIKEPSEIQNIEIINKDFLFWNTDKRYDLVIGNPPYIVKKRLENEQVLRCKEIHIEHNLSNKEISNIWTSFVLKSSDYLNENGVLAFVLPTEILQVKYAEEIRQYLISNFQRVEIITFRHLAFDVIEQDTVVLFTYKTCPQENQGVYMIEVDAVEVLNGETPNFNHLPDSCLGQKWTTSILAEEDILLVDHLSTRLRKVKDYCSSGAGIVTAATDFFIINQSKKLEFHLDEFSKKIIQRGGNVNGCVDFTNERFEALVERNAPCFLLDTNNLSIESNGLKEYLKYGIEIEVDTKYKCRLRNRWHDVPGIKKGEGFFFKRSHNYPKCIKNSADVYVTDSAYQIVMHENYQVENLIYSFYNSLTLLAAEMQGRYYGGGVLELTPNEFKNLPIPYMQCEDFAEFSMSFENKNQIEDVLGENDIKILSIGMGLSDEKIKRIQEAYKMMKSRRMRA
jgi:adenine-specific DNA-methyltransferase